MGGNQPLARPAGEAGAEHHRSHEVGEAVGGAHDRQLGVAVGQRPTGRHQHRPEPGRTQGHHRRRPALAEGVVGPYEQEEGAVGE